MKAKDKLLLENLTRKYGKNILANMIKEYKENITYTIVVKCDPYFSKKYYNGQTVISRDGRTPVEWVLNDFSRHLSLEEAFEELTSIAFEVFNENDNIIYFKTEEDVIDFFEDMEMDYDDYINDFEGEGFYLITYKGMECEYKVGVDKSIRDDSLLFSIEEDKFDGE